MDLDYGPEYDVFRKQVRAFIEAHGHLAPLSADRAARPSSKAVDWQKLLIEHGYTARTIPQEYGGYGAEPDILQSRIIAEEFARARVPGGLSNQRSEEHTSELQSLMRNSYAVFCLKKNKTNKQNTTTRK